VRTIIDTLRALFTRRLTLGETARFLGLDQGELDHRLTLLARMGYVRHQTIDPEGCASSSCRGCAFSSRSASGCDAVISGYELTKKGQMVLGS